MPSLKRIFLGLLCGLLLLSSGCGQKPITPLAPPEDTTQRDAAAMFNKAVEQLENAESYTMTGSVSSSSVMGEVLTSVVSLVNCCYEVVDGAGVMLIGTEQRYDGKVFPHSTYFADGKYHISALDSKYIVSTNDFGDYDGLGYAKKVEEAALSNCRIMPHQDDDGYQVYFRIPYGIYYSEALDSWFGALVDESLQHQPVTVTAEIDGEGRMTLLYISVENTTDFDGTAIEQSVILSLSFADYNASQVTAPEDLASYEDRTVEGNGGQNQGEEPPTVEFTGDSLD